MEKFGSLVLERLENGVGIATLDRPPVNAVSLSVYEDIGALSARVEQGTDIRVLVLAAREDARAWCGGADLNDFVGMDTARRKERYRFINEKLPSFYNLTRPVIAAVNGSAIGIGMILAGLCDMRVAAEDAKFACPEIDYGLVCGGGGLFAMLKMPEAKMREILFTGRKFTARELEPTGFLNYVVPRGDVMPKALELAGQIAGKSLPSIQARKIASTRLEGKSWMEAYLEAQALSADLVATRDSQEGVQAFLQRRPAQFGDN